MIRICCPRCNGRDVTPIYQLLGENQHGKRYERDFFCHRCKIRFGGSRYYEQPKTELERVAQTRRF